MRAIQLFFLCLFLVVCAVITSAGRGLGSLWEAYPASASEASISPASRLTSFAFVQIRGPDTPVPNPNSFPSLATKRRVDMTQLRADSQELSKLAATIPEQVNLVGKGELPKDLIDNLRKIEKLSKHLRTEISP
jgi:hypothetical protein